MTSRGNTGPTAPGWIHEQVARLEEAWPPLVLASGTALVILVQLWFGEILWTSEPAVFYALP